MAYTQITVFSCECANCAHKWITRNESLPDRCPKCKARGWNADHVSINTPAQTTPHTPRLAHRKPSDASLPVADTLRLEPEPEPVHSEPENEFYDDDDTDYYADDDDDWGDTGAP